MLQTSPGNNVITETGFCCLQEMTLTTGCLERYLCSLTTNDSMFNLLRELSLNIKCKSSCKGKAQGKSLSNNERKLNGTDCQSETSE